MAKAKQIFGPNTKNQPVVSTKPNAKGPELKKETSNKPNNMVETMDLI